MFHAADGLGVNQGLLTRSADGDLDAVVLFSFAGRRQKRFVGSKIRQSSLQWQGVVVLFDLSATAKRPHLGSPSAHTQALFPNANVPVSRMPGQEFFFRYGRSFGSSALALVTAADSDFSAHSVSMPLPSLRICSMALASASWAVQP